MAQRKGLQVLFLWLGRVRGLSRSAPVASSTCGWYQGAEGKGPGQTPGDPRMLPQCHRAGPSPVSLPSFLLCSLRSSARPNQHHLPLSTTPSGTTSFRLQALDPQSAQ